MGENEEQQEPPMTLNVRNLEVLSILGRGGKGTVFHVRNESNNEETLALKVISKASIENKKKSEEKDNDDDDDDDDKYRRIWFERDVLKLFRHPLLPQLRGVVVTDTIFGFAIDYCSGGDLNSLRKKQSEKTFSDDIIRFYAAELVLALEYLHGFGIVYRDLKPENIMIQENGHLMLIDFDLSTKLSVKSTETRRSISSTTTTTALESRTVSNSIKKNRIRQLSSYLCCTSGVAPVDSVYLAETRVNPERSDSVSPNGEKSKSFVGTEEYVAPEMILGNGHDFAVDWWSLGVVLYEMLYGQTPFRGSNRKETFYRILTKTPELAGDQTTLRDLIGKLLEKDPLKRISVEDIKGHEFFRSVNWDSVARISRPPFIPVKTRNENERRNFKGIDELELFVKNMENKYKISGIYDTIKQIENTSKRKEEGNKDEWENF